jgi:hypothetical protein
MAMDLYWALVTLALKALLQQVKYSPAAHQNPAIEGEVVSFSGPKLQPARHREHRADAASIWQRP